MSDNEQKAGCVDRLRELIAFVNGKCTNEEAGRKCLGFIVLHGAELEAALSPARSGEAVEIAKQMQQWGGDAAEYYVREFGRKLERALGVIAPRNESSGVSPGGGEPFAWVEPGTFNCVSHETRMQFPEDARTFDVPVYRHPPTATPAPQDSVRVGGGDWIAKLKREVMMSKMTHAFTFSRDEVIELLGGMAALTTPAPAAGADGEDDGGPYNGIDWKATAHELLHRLETMQPPNVLLQQVKMLGEMAALLRCMFPLSDGAGQSAGGG